MLRKITPFQKALQLIQVQCVGIVTVYKLVLIKGSKHLNNSFTRFKKTTSRNQRIPVVHTENFY